MKVKELEQELKNVKKSYDAKIKKLEKKISTGNGSSINISNGVSNSKSNDLYRNLKRLSVYNSIFHRSNNKGCRNEHDAY